MVSGLVSGLCRAVSGLLDRGDQLVVSSGVGGVGVSGCRGVGLSGVSGCRAHLGPRSHHGEALHVL